MKPKRPGPSEELAEAWKAGGLSLHAAVERHWQRIGLWPVSDDTFLVLELILGFANLGLFDRLIPVGGGERVTVGEAVERFQLSAFLG